MESKKVLVTGANGYIGRYLGQIVAKRGYVSLGSVRKVKENTSYPFYDDIKSSGDINGSTDWGNLLSDVESVIHLAGCAHKVGKLAKKHELDYQVINRDGAIRLAEQAAEYGVKRFIYISSIGVLGDKTESKAFDNNSPYNPINQYTHSKMEAEKSLLLLSKKTNMEIIILRPPLVYGPGAPGNFNRLLKLLFRFRVLPFGSFTAVKSMVSLQNLCDLIVHCLDVDLPKNNVFAVTDNSDWTMKELIELLARFANIKIYNLRIPLGVLMFFSAFIGKNQDIEKLANSLYIDDTTLKDLNWSPCQEPLDGLLEAVDYFKKSNEL